MSYDDTNYGLILKQLSTDHTAILPKNRAQLLDDTLTIARAMTNIVSYEKAMDLTKYLALERDYAPWTAAANALDFIDMMLYGFSDFSEWKVSIELFARKKRPLFLVLGLITNILIFIGLCERLGDSTISVRWL